MFVTDPIADMLTRIRNANRMKHATVLVPASSEKEAILNVLIKEGYIVKYEKINSGVISNLVISLKYVENERVIRGLKRISKPGLRVYSKKSNIPKVLNGLGIAVISTSKGILSDREARLQGVGGEILAYIW